MRASSRVAAVFQQRIWLRLPLTRWSASSQLPIAGLLSRCVTTPGHQLRSDEQPQPAKSASGPLAFDRQRLSAALATLLWLSLVDKAAPRLITHASSSETNTCCQTMHECWSAFVRNTLAARTSCRALVTAPSTILVHTILAPFVGPSSLESVRRYLTEQNRTSHSQHQAGDRYLLGKQLDPNAGRSLLTCMWCRDAST